MFPNWWSLMRISKERKDNMAKRSCRRTEEESAIHGRAVKMRKMTDKQLVDYVDGMVEKARSEKHFDLAEFIMDIGKLPGVGQATLGKIIELAEEGGYIANE